MLMVLTLESAAALVLSIHVQPKASKDEIAGPHGDRIKIRITAPPIDGRANQHLVDFLADTFDVPKRNVLLLSGETGRNKRFKIIGPSRIPEAIREAPPGSVQVLSEP